MWSRLFTRIISSRRIFASSAALPPAIMWFWPDWMRQKNLREEDAEPDQLLLTLKKAKLAEIRKEFTKSERLYHQGLQILDDRFEAGEVSDSNLVLFRLHIYSMLANAAFSRNDLTAAENLYKACAHGFVHQLEYPTTHLAVVEVSLKLAIIYATVGRQADAEAGYKFCLETMESNEFVKKDNKTKEIGDDAKNALGLYGMCLDAYARFLIDLFRYSEAIPIARKAVEVCDRVFPPDHPTRLSVANLLGNALVGSGRTEEAEHTFRDCVTVAKKSLDLEITLRNQEDSNSELKKINEIELARVLCACQCNCANALYRLNLGDANADRRRETEARQFCKAAKSLGEKYRDDYCLREARRCMAQFEENNESDNEK